MLLFPSAAASLTRLKLVPAVCAVTTPERSKEHTSELQSPVQIVCRLLLELTVNDELAGPLVVPSLAVIVVSSTLTIFFSFFGFGGHRVLLSFPTRRSSDLGPL